MALPGTSAGKPGTNNDGFAADKGYFMQCTPGEPSITIDVMFHQPQQLNFAVMQNSVTFSGRVNLAQIDSVYGSITQWQTYKINHVDFQYDSIINSSSSSSTFFWIYGVPWPRGVQAGSTQGSKSWGDIRCFPGCSYKILTVNKDGLSGAGQGQGLYTISCQNPQYSVSSRNEQAGTNYQNPGRMYSSAPLSVIADGDTGLTNGRDATDWHCFAFQVHRASSAVLDVVTVFVVAKINVSFMGLRNDLKANPSLAALGLDYIYLQSIGKGLLGDFVPAFSRPADHIEQAHELENSGDALPRLRELQYSEVQGDSSESPSRKSRLARSRESDGEQHPKAKYRKLQKLL